MIKICFRYLSSARNSTQFHEPLLQAEMRSGCFCCHGNQFSVWVIREYKTSAWKRSVDFYINAEVEKQTLHFLWLLPSHFWSFVTDQNLEEKHLHGIQMKRIPLTGVNLKQVYLFETYFSKLN